MVTPSEFVSGALESRKKSAMRDIVKSNMLRDLSKGRVPRSLLILDPKK